MEQVEKFCYQYVFFSRYVNRLTIDAYLQTCQKSHICRRIVGVDLQRWLFCVPANMLLFCKRKKRTPVIVMRAVRIQICTRNSITQLDYRPVALNIWELLWMKLKSSIFWDIMPYSPLKINRRFGGTCRLHLRGLRISQARNQREAGGRQSSALNMIRLSRIGWIESRQLLIVEPRFQSQISPSWICCGQSGAGPGVFATTALFPCQLSFHQCPILSSTIRDWYNRSICRHINSGLSLVPPTG
jgi:hypothetical protein